MSRRTGKRRTSSGKSQSNKRRKEHRSNSPMGEIVVNPPTLSRARTRSQTALAQPVVVATSSPTPMSANTAQPAHAHASPEVSDGFVANRGMVIIRDIEEAIDRMKKEAKNTDMNNAEMRKVLNILVDMQEDQRGLIDSVEELEFKYSESEDVIDAINDLKKGQRKMDAAMYQLNTQFNTLSENQDQILHTLDKINSKLSESEQSPKEESVELPLSFQNASDIPDGSRANGAPTSPLPPSSPVPYSSPQAEEGA